jgi:hypothetical protein
MKYCGRVKEKRTTGWSDGNFPRFRQLAVILAQAGLIGDSQRRKYEPSCSARLSPGAPAISAQAGILIEDTICHIVLVVLLCSRHSQADA